MIQAGALHPATEMPAVGDQCDIDEKGIRHIGQQGFLQTRALSHRRRGLHPGIQNGIARFGVGPIHRFNHPDIQVEAGDNHEFRIEVALRHLPLALAL